MRITMLDNVSVPRMPRIVLKNVWCNPTSRHGSIVGCGAGIATTLWDSTDRNVLIILYTYLVSIKDGDSPAHYAAVAKFIP